MRAALLASLLVATAAHAQVDDDEDVPIRDTRILERPPNLVVSASFTDVFDPEIVDRLSTGFVTTIVLRAYLYRRGATIPVSVAAATYRVVYDLWKEIYLVQVRDPTGEKSYEEKTRADAIRRVTALVDFPVASVSAIERGAEYFVGVEVEVNPVSPELLAEVRRWLLRPSLGGASFFGGFVSVFINPKVAEADRALRFRSRAFYLVKK